MSLTTLQKNIRDTNVSASDEHDLLSLATMGHAAIAAALHLWEQTAPTDLKGMLIGEQGWRWDRSIQGYRNTSGRIVNGVELKDLAVAVASALKKKSKHSLLLMLLGNTQVMPWRSQTASDVSSLYVLLAAMGVGGFFHLSPAIKKMVAGHPTRPSGLLYTLGRLKRFSEQLEHVRDTEKAQADLGVPSTIPRTGLEQRMGMYVDSGHAIFEGARRASYSEEAVRVGKRLEVRNILGNGDHCETRDGVLGCPEQTARGWVDADDMTLPGERPCVTNCLCHLDFRLVDA